jgi:hypothetical protein
MKTKFPGAGDKPPLPPPPAPPARDANPWTISDAAGTGRTPAAPGPATRRRRFEPDLSRARPARERPVRFMPLAVLLFIAGAGVNLALQALREGNVEAAIGALVVVGLVAFVLVRRFVAKR